MHSWGRIDELSGKEEEVGEGVQNLGQTIQEQTLESAQDFYGNSLGSLKSRLENSRFQLQDLLEQLPDSQKYARAQIEEWWPATKP